MSNNMLKCWIALIATASVTAFIIGMIHGTINGLKMDLAESESRIAAIENLILSSKEVPAPAIQKLPE